MSGFKTDIIRNFCLISHGGAGKTSLTENILYNAGKIDNVGSIERGNTKSDFTPEEKKHQFSISNSYFSFAWKNYLINLIDTPGYADFRGEVAGALRMVEGSVILIDGTAGIEVNTNYVWKMAKKNQLPRIIFVNKMDKDGAKFTDVYNEIKNNYEGTFVPLTIPVGAGEKYQGVVDLLTNQFYLSSAEGEKKVEIPEYMKSEVDEKRTELIEAVVERDEQLMDKYFAEEEITNQELIDGLIKAVFTGEIIPVLAGSALKNSGLNILLDYLVKIVPSPDTIDIIKGSWEEDDVELEISEKRPTVGIIGKTMVDPYIGKLSIFRLLSGSLTKDSEIYVPRLDKSIRISKIYKLNGEKQENVERLIAGDIGAVAKLDELETSDTITDGTKIILAPIDFPVPMLIQAALPASKGDDEKMSSSLNRLSQEDPTFRVDYNVETKELLVTGMGTVHLEVIKKICKRKFGVEFVTTTPKVAYKETFQTKVEVEEKYKKQSGGRGQYGHVFLRLEPLPRGKGFEFAEEIFGGAIPNQYIPAVEKGIVEAKKEGMLAFYPVVDFKVTVYDGSYHPVDSSEMAFKIAASKGFKKGMSQAKPVLLEPIMDISVIVPEEYMGDIMGDLNSRRGKILGMDAEDGKQIIKAQVPQSELFTYTTDLKSITGGHGIFTREFAYFDKVPAKLEEEIINNRKSETA